MRELISADYLRPFPAPSQYLANAVNPVRWPTRTRADPLPAGERPEGTKSICAQGHTPLMTTRYAELIARSEMDPDAWIEAWNADPKPFVWVKTADEILDNLAAYCTRLN
jgi:hypothetical protein